MSSHGIFYGLPPTKAPKEEHFEGYHMITEVSAIGLFCGEVHEMTGTRNAALLVNLHFLIDAVQNLQLRHRETFYKLNSEIPLGIKAAFLCHKLER